MNGWYEVRSTATIQELWYKGEVEEARITHEEVVDDTSGRRQIRATAKSRIIGPSHDIASSWP